MPIVLFLLLLVIYIHNLSRSVYGGDVGDLVTSAVIGGVPHPPGYPLFTLFGFLLTRLTSIVNQTPAFLVGLISAISSAGAVAIYFIFANRSTKSLLVALIASLTLAFTFLFWFYAEIAEVFALNNFFVVLLLFLAYEFYSKKKLLFLYALSFVAGLALTNHHTIIFIFPALLMMVWRELLSSVKTSKKTLIWCFLFGVVGFAPYLYAVVASLTHPFIDWANITSLQDVIDLILRKKYGTFQLASFHNITPAARFVVLKTYFIVLLTQLTIPVTALSLLGIVALFRKDKIVAIALSSAFLLSGPFFVVYAGFFLNNSFYFGIYERFLSLSAIIFLFFFPFGLLAFTTFLSRFFSRKEYGYLFKGVFILIPFMLFIYNMPKTDLSQVWIGDILGENHLAVLPRKSVLFLSGDTNLFNTWYVRYARHVRPDTEVMNGLSPEKTVEIFGKKYQRTRAEDFVSVLDRLDHERPVFSDLRFTGKEVKGTWVPYGLYYEYRNTSEKKLTYEEYALRTQEIWSKMRLPTNEEKESVAYNNHTISVFPEMYANGLVVAGNYFLSEYQKKSDALSYYKRALEVDPLYAKAYGTLGAFYLTDERDCEQAIPFLRKSIELYPFDKNYYYLLYLSMRECNVGKDEQNQVAAKFSELFGVSLINSLKEYEKNQTDKPKL